MPEKAVGGRCVEGMGLSLENMSIKPGPTLQWVEHTMCSLSAQGYTGTMTIRFVAGGVQALVVNQELSPRQPVPIHVRSDVHRP